MQVHNEKAIFCFDFIIFQLMLVSQVCHPFDVTGVNVFGYFPLSPPCPNLFLSSSMIHFLTSVPASWQSSHLSFLFLLAACIRYEVFADCFIDDHCSQCFHCSNLHLDIHILRIFFTLALPCPSSRQTPQPLHTGSSFLSKHSGLPSLCRSLPPSLL